MRLVLALDTATQECAVGLARWPDADTGEPELVGETNVATPRAALTHAVPMVERLLAECGHPISAVGAVVVGRGPGSFTGVRIGIATAKGLAQGLGVPLYGVGTLDAVAERFAGRDGLVAVVGDAMRREVYPALFRCEGGSVIRLAPDSVARPFDVATRWAAELDEPVLLAGDGLAKYMDVFAAALGARAEIAPPAMWGPTGGSLLQAAWRNGAPSQDGRAATVLPIYTRLSDAEEAERDRVVGPYLPGSGVAGPDAGVRP
ncbi:MAG: tRNA (adenosine(37)-N6)-threonylcarbamoyltransferase complex dimerization subunit type 1 TsaB [Coriobacteriia bacterium]|nr:tRNA (adenosine(37)-N6)-threonylcarbamoyltransferase complex dimerization subunit type 1 TsaB [Coriobacteriia bacterium]